MHHAISHNQVASNFFTQWHKHWGQIKNTLELGIYCYNLQTGTTVRTIHP